MAKSHLKLVTPATVKRTVTPTRLPNRELRKREYLTPDEVEVLKARGTDVVAMGFKPRPYHDPRRGLMSALCLRPCARRRWTTNSPPKTAPVVSRRIRGLAKRLRGASQASGPIR
jgi:hypothetical protein